MKRPFAKAAAIADRFRALAGARPLCKAGKTGELYIYEQIGLDWWTGGGITAKSVQEALDGDLKSCTALNIFINSEGGDVFEAKAIYTQLKRFGAEKTVHVDGIAASAATLIAMVGDKIISSSVSTWMVHEAWSVAIGPAGDMRKMADLLDLENNIIAETYAKKTGATVEKMRELMAAETWMNATQALEQGFTDEISADEAAAEEAAPAAANKLEQLAALTKERLKGATAASLMQARADMRRRNLPGQPGRSEPASR